MLTTMITGSTERRSHMLEDGSMGWEVWCRADTMKWVMVSAKLWFEARELGAAKLGLSPLDCEARPFGGQKPAGSTAS